MGLLCLVCAFAVGNLFVGDQDWTWVALIAALVVFFARNALTLLQSNRPWAPYVVLDETAVDRAFRQEPTPIEAAHGFVRYQMQTTSFGAVVDALPAASLHFGVEVLAVSSDGVFRIPGPQGAGVPQGACPSFARPIFRRRIRQLPGSVAVGPSSPSDCLCLGGIAVTTGEPGGRLQV